MDPRSRPRQLSPLLPPLTFPSEDALNRVRHFWVSNRSDPAFRPLCLMTAEVRPAEDSGEIVTFAFFLMAGLFPPFSDFFMEVPGSC